MHPSISSNKLSTLCSDLNFSETEIFFINAFTSAHMLVVDLLQAPSFSTARLCFNSLSRGLTTLFHTLLSLQMRLQASLDLACITLMSLSVIFFFLFTKTATKIRTSLFTYTFEGKLPIRQGVHFLSVFPGAGFSTCALRGAPATSLVTPALFSRFQDSQ